MSRIVPLNTEAHRDLRVDARPSAALGDAQRFVPVVVSEVSRLAARCPILFSKDAETGAFYCGAMLGFDEGENLFLKDGAGYEGYRPLNLQRGPFFTAGGDLAIDLDSPRISESGEGLFTDEGRPSAYLESVMALFRELKPGLERTKLFIDTLLKLKLVEPITLDVGFDDGETRELVGLYGIDQEALRALGDEQALELFRRGYLQLIYVIIGSLQQIAVLAETKNRRLARFGEALSPQFA